MIQIIKNGNNCFYADCIVCNCKFSYELEDITEGFNCVKCPCCGNLVKHNARNFIEQPTKENKK